MKKVDQLPPLMQIAYKQFVEADKAFAEAKKRKEERKASVLALLKKEQTDGFIVKGKKVIHAVTKKGSQTIDKTKLKRDHKSIHDAYLKQGKDSVSLTVIEDKNLLQEQKENGSTNP